MPTTFLQDTDKTAAYPQQNNKAMLNIKKFVCNMFQENCYVVSDETNECVIIDCGARSETERNGIADYIRDNGLKPRHLLCTHAHIDHNFGNDFIFTTYGLRPTLHKADVCLYERLSEQAVYFTGSGYESSVKQPGTLLEDGDTVAFGCHEFKIISTPGHSPGSVFLYCSDEKTAFSGDTLFRMSMGRIDLEGGDYDRIIDSLTRITSALPEDTVVYPGHGPKTSIRDEKLMNPFF